MTSSSSEPPLSASSSNADKDDEDGEPVLPVVRPKTFPVLKTFPVMKDDNGLWSGAESANE